MITDRYDVGIYCRLSLDDDRAGESVSIENQRDLLRKYVKDQGWNEIEVYIDDGYSGTNFNRPSVQRMIADAKSGRINIIVVKDLSRFGRNYIEIGQFTDYLFPSIGCRFIALNNGVDTKMNSSNNDMMGFLNLFNEFYSRDTSKKVKSARKSCAENGKFLGSITPYGYKRDPENKYHLIIDEELAPIVRRIFDLRCEGKGYRGIALMLNEEGIIPPRTLYYHKKGTDDPRKVSEKWSQTTVKSIMLNEAYIGHMVQFKSGKMSYKSRKQIIKSKEDWIRVENTHEPLIKQDVWDTVTSMNKQRFRKRIDSEGKVSIFTGLVRCADCGFKMACKRTKSRRKDGLGGYNSSFLCGSYRRNGKTACTAHTIQEDALLLLVIADIQEKAQLVLHDETKIAERIVKMKSEENNSRFVYYERELKSNIARISEIEKLMQNLYEDRIKGTVPESIFATLMDKYETERSEKAASIPDLQHKIQSGRQGMDNINKWILHIRKYTEIREINEAILIELVDKIEIGESTVVDSKRICDIKIYYRYVGCIDEAIEEKGIKYGQAV